jgi:hypothetical protein
VVSTPLPVPTSTPLPLPGFTHTPGPVCSPLINSGCSLPDGFIQGVDPANGSGGVPLSLNSITVFFTQAMSAVDKHSLYEIRGHFLLVVDNENVVFLSMFYN